MARIARRRVLKLSASGGMAAILASGRAPALAQETAVHWLRWTDFVPASDALLKGQITQDCKKATGITLKVETVNANDLQSRITSAIQSGTGADIIMAISNWPQLYAESLADAGDVAEEIGKAQGGYYDVSKLVATVGNKWIGVPWTVGGGLIAYRKSWFEEIGYDTFPETWDTLLDAGKKLKAKGRPIGQTAGHTFGDAPGWWYPFLWSLGGKEVEADGKTVVLNSKETVEFDQVRGRSLEGDHGRGRARLGRHQQQPRLPVGHHQRHQQRRLDLHRSQEQARNVPDREGHADVEGHPCTPRIPKGPGGQFNLPGTFTDMLMGYSKNQKAAKDFLRWMHSKAVFDEWFTSQQGYTCGATRMWEKHKVWDADPVLRRSATCRPRAGWPATRGRPTARPPKW